MKPTDNMNDLYGFSWFCQLLPSKLENESAVYRTTHGINVLLKTTSNKKGINLKIANT